MNVEQARFNMIEQQIRPWDVSDSAVLELLSAVRREDFVPHAHRALAFADMELPLSSHDAALARGQIMLAPKIEARMLQDLAVLKNERVLEIGTGSGYMAALLAHQAQHVITLEIDPALAQNARQNLQNAGITNVDVRQADGAEGVPAEAPFDVIVLSGSVAAVPQVLLDALKPGGRLLAITGEEPVMRATLFSRTSASEWAAAQPWDTIAPRLLNFPEAPVFRF